MINLTSILHILIAFGACQAIFLAIIFFTRNKGGLSNRFLALFLTIEGVTLIERLLAEINLIVAIPHLLGISYPLNFIKPPIIFFMSLAIVDPGFRIGKKHIFHTIPFFLILLTNVPFYMMSANDKLAYVSEFITYVPSYSSFDFWLFTSFYLYIEAYLILSILRLIEYRKHVKNNKPANWYLSVLKLYTLGLSAGFLYFLIRPTGMLEIPHFNVISMLVMTFLIQSIAYNFISKTQLFNSGGPVMKDVDQRINDENIIRKKLEVEKIFLDDTLTLESFANSIQMSKKYVSDIINQRFGYTFREVLNQHRVEEAKKIMANPSESELGLIDIGMKSGFNNKVSFYRSFKRFTGKSPSEYVEILASQKKSSSVSK